MAYLDLDALAPKDKIVKLHGTEYRLPGSPDGEVMVQLLELQQRLEESAGDNKAMVGLLKEMQQQVLEVFRIRQPDLPSLRLDLKQTQAVFTFVMELYDDDDGPPTKPRKGNKGKKGKKRTRSETSSQPSPDAAPVVGPPAPEPVSQSASSET